MLTVTTTGNRRIIFRGEIAKVIVYKMMKMDFITVTKSDYMTEVRDRLKVVYDVDIKFNDYEEFLNELERAGFITMERRGNEELC